MIRATKRPGTAPVPLVIMTHSAIEADVTAALAEIDRLDVVRAPSVRRRGISWSHGAVPCRPVRLVGAAGLNCVVILRPPTSVAIASFNARVLEHEIPCRPSTPS